VDEVKGKISRVGASSSWIQTLQPVSIGAKRYGFGPLISQQERVIMEVFEKTVNEVAEVFMFEHWIRFYFLNAQGDDLVLNIPPKALEKISEHYPHLGALAETMNGQSMSPERSQESICTHISMTVEQRQTDANAVSNVLNSPKLNAELYAFNLWVEANEQQLEERFLEFSTWKDIYIQWKSSEKGKEFLSSLITGEGRAQGKTH
jgi:hypothetical protein